MSRADLVIGIDPGISGAIAALAHTDKGPKFWRVESMPIELKKSGKRQVDVDALRVIFSTLWEDVQKAQRDDSYMHFLIEQVSAMPGQGVSGMFSLGDSFGCVRAMAATFGEVSMVTPQQWKSAMGVTVDKETREREGKNATAKMLKHMTLTMARRVYPAARPYLQRKKDEGRAEAILLAHYARKHLRF
jgi:crossover junction endodeoxyribonuclease RuvC